jgi:hypothetical protein
MHAGDIVFYPTQGGYIQYIIQKVINDTLVVTSYKTKQQNWVSKSDVIDVDDFINIYKHEKIYR